jgi:multiple sugar transport system permease protein
VLALIAYPVGYAVHLSMFNRRMTEFIGLDNFVYLLGRGRLWMILFQTSLFAIGAVAIKVPLGFVLAHLVNNLPARGQRKWRGMLLVPWVIPPALSVVAWRELLDPSYSAFNWILVHILGPQPVFWLGDTGWARFSIILVSVWFGAPFFMIMFLASLKSVPEELYEAASIDGATGWQRFRYVTLPMMRNVIAISTMFALIGGFTGFTVVSVLTNGGPLGTTTVLATASFMVGIMGGHLPMGAAISLFMLPFLAVAATVILRGIAKRGSDV